MDAPRKRGRPRREGAGDEILRVARELLAESGYRDFNVDVVAARSGIAKTTIYRRWPSKAALVAAAIVPPAIAAPEAGELLHETARLLALLRDADGDAIEVVRAIVEPRFATLRTLRGDRDASMLVGALLTRLLIAREPLDRPFVDSLL